MFPYVKTSIMRCSCAIEHLALFSSHTSRRPFHSYLQRTSTSSPATWRSVTQASHSGLLHPIFLLLFATVFSAREGGGWLVLNGTAHLGKQLGYRGKEKRNLSKVTVVPNRNKVTEVYCGVRGPSPGRGQLADSIGPCPTWCFSPFLNSLI